MRVLHVITSISRQGGGPSRSSQGLVGALRAAGVDVWLMTLSRGETPWIKGCEQFVNGGAFEDALDAVRPDLVHLHGLWDPRLHRCAVLCRRRHIPYVIAPRGMLEPWSLKTKWLKKRLARFLYQDRDLKHAAVLHATAESEAAQFRALGFRNPVIISPNGVNVPEEKEKKIGGENRWTAEGGFLSAPKTYTSDKKRRALFVSRMHPKKGVLELVESWSRVFKNGTNHCSPSTFTSPPWVCELVYTLNGDTEREYEAKVKQRILDLGMTYVDAESPPDFIFTGPLDDDAKWQAYDRADLFILPTYSENFGIVIAEALWAGVPVITTKGTPWSELEGKHHCSPSPSTFTLSPGRCGWWIDLPEKKKVGGESRSTVEWPALDAALKEATTLPITPTPVPANESTHHCPPIFSTYFLPPTPSPATLRAMGENGHKLILEKYTWPAVVKAMIRGYERIVVSAKEST